MIEMVTGLPRMALSVFSAYRAEEGYMWKTQDAIVAGVRWPDGLSPDNYIPSEPVICKKIYDGYRVLALTLENMQESGREFLFSEFANLNQDSNDDILYFANKYGFLTDGETLPPVPCDIKNPRMMRVLDFTFERRSFWIEQVDLMGKAFLLWKSIINRDELTLSTYISWSGNEPVYHVNQKYKGSFWTYQVSPTVFASFRRGDLLLPAKAVLQLIINQQIREYKTLPVLYLDDKSMNLVQFFNPENLLAAIWFQFFQVVSGERRIRKCDICHRWSDVTDLSASWTRHAECANRDRVNKSRKLPKIHKLLSEGKNIDEIKLAMRTTDEELARWLKEEVR